MSIILQNEFGSVEVKPGYAGGPESAQITITALPGDVVKVLEANKIKGSLPARAYVQRARRVAGEWSPFRGLKVEGIPPQISIDGRAGLAALWEAADSHERRRNQDAEAARAAERDRFAAAVPAGSVLVRLSGSVPDPWEAGMSISVYSDAAGRRHVGPPEVRSADGTMGYVPEEAMAKAGAAAAAERAKEAADRREQRRRAKARVGELLAVGVPAEAVSAYKRCGGDPERLPDDIDNPDYWLVKKYADAIEEQGLAFSGGRPRPDSLSQVLDD